MNFVIIEGDGVQLLEGYIPTSPSFGTTAENDKNWFSMVSMTGDDQSMRVSLAQLIPTSFDSATRVPSSESVDECVRIFIEEQG